MNRRGFFKGLAAAALCATANVYGFLPLPYQGSRFSWDKGLQVASSETLVEWARKWNPNGDLPAIAKLLTQQNEILKDMVFVSGEPGPFRTTIKTKLPEVAWT
jgi:hypothetical protein